MCYRHIAAQGPWCYLVPGLLIYATFPLGFLRHCITRSAHLRAYMISPALYSQNLIQSDYNIHLVSVVYSNSSTWIPAFVSQHSYNGHSISLHVEFLEPSTRRQSRQDRSSVRTFSPCSTTVCLNSVSWRIAIDEVGQQISINATSVYIFDSSGCSRKHTQGQYEPSIYTCTETWKRDRWKKKRDFMPHDH